MENITKNLGLIIIVIAAILMLVVMMTDNVNNTWLATAGGLGILGLLVQIYIGRSMNL